MSPYLVLIPILAILYPITWWLARGWAKHRLHFSGHPDARAIRREEWDVHKRSKMTSHPEPSWKKRYWQSIYEEKGYVSTAIHGGILGLILGGLQILLNFNREGFTLQRRIALLILFPVFIAAYNVHFEWLVRKFARRMQETGTKQTL
jgi:hypothetical protein